MVREVSARVVLLVLAVPSLVCYLLLVDNNTDHYHPLTTEDPEDLWWADWNEVHRSRRAAVHHNCLHARKGNVVSFSRLLSSRKYLYNLLLDERHKAIYCYVPKVACTNWKRMMMILSGRTNKVDPLNISSHVPHEEGVLTRLSVARIKSSLLNYKLRTYTKFLIVRHPMERLVSAYRNKLVINSTSAADFKKRFGVTIMKKYRKGSSAQKIPKNGHGVTFAEFVSYIVERKQESHQSLNEHWASYVDLCHPCTIRYNIIGKYETLEEDSEYILRKIGAPPDLHFPPVVPSRTASLVADYMASLSPELGQKLYDLYRLDFKLFEYDYSNI
ncbi:carbohydrate sulfotransferase 11-like isoform X2 [Homarus americanus]|uniref:carbohydrate sulfotransferase 11-like isoform X2 n=1 Tax=Homarus americanus TaxID=6706 RepID=UPI001C464F24|nr:carbohydrate sulfotransferase 11-like isoform X2 [Homarus americanus]